jgi:hypothetical protein
MSLPPPLKRLAAGARRRDALVALGIGVPALAALVAVATRVFPMPVVVAVASGAAAALAYVVARRWRQRDDAWAARRLDAGYRRFEDSADLLLRAPESLAPLVRLQRERMLRRLDAETALDLRERWPLRPLLLAWLIAAAVATLAVLWPAPPATEGASPATAERTGAAAATHLLEARLAIRAPQYTGVAERTATELDARVEEGAQVAWSLKLDAHPTAVTLRFHDGSRLALAALDDASSSWRGAREIASPLLYRVELEGAPPLADAGPHRLELIPDRAPEVRVLEPDRTLTVLDGRQTQWTLAFEASDDYGIGAARLELTLAQGTGENVTFKSRTIELQGEGEARLKRYRHVLDLKALGIAAGDDVIVRLRISDRRAPEPNTTRSASFILRWPPEAGSEGSGVEGVVERALPAYFRSQRQIIIDTEALAAERPKLRDEAFAQRANGIAETRRCCACATASSSARNRRDRGGGRDRARARGRRASPEARIGAKADSAFGQLGDTEAEFGHVHDIAEAATLLDTETRETLRRALSAMWQAERQLRQADLKQRCRPRTRRSSTSSRCSSRRASTWRARARAAGDRRDAPPDRRPPRRHGAGRSLVARNVDAVPAALWQSLRDGGAPDFGALRTGSRRTSASCRMRSACWPHWSAWKRIPRAPRAAISSSAWPGRSCARPRPARACATRAAIAGRRYLDALGEPGS